MKTIHKYSLKPTTTEDYIVDMPIDSQIIKFDYQFMTWTIWAVVDTDMPFKTRHFKIFGTGWEIDPNLNLKHMETVLTRDKSFVWHLFELLP